jgi:hypothetical protein
VETRVACLRDALFDMWHGVKFKMVHTGKLEVDGREGGLIICHGVMLKVERVLDKRFHSADEWLRCKHAESQSLVQPKKRATRCSGWRTVV